MAEVNGTEASETLIGTDSDDIIRGYGGDDVLVGGDGDDRLYGYQGNNTLDGGSGNDHLSVHNELGNNELIGGPGDDDIFGAKGDDTLTGGDGNDILRGYEGDDVLVGGDGDDRLYGYQGNNTLDGGSGNDHLSVHNELGNNELIGGPGDDDIFGAKGDDTLTGGDGNDILRGYEGDDTLDGGEGFDYLIGGSGNDTYIISSKNFYISDSSGDDTAIVSTEFVKVPSNIESVAYDDGILPLPYWIDSLLHGHAAAYSSLLGEDKIFYYGFPDTVPEYDIGSDDTNGYTPFNTAQKNFTRSVLNYIETIVDITFIETISFNQPNTITLANNIRTGIAAGIAGQASSPRNSAQGSDLFLNLNTPGNLNPEDGTYSSLVLIHELGHALGLKHPFSDPNPSGQIAAPPYLPEQDDSSTWTVMASEKDPKDYHAIFQPLDIAALQYAYGPNPNFRTEDDTYIYDQYSANFIWDGGGVDTIDASSSIEKVTIYLEPGYHGFNGETKSQLITAYGQITVNFGTEIENLIGSNNNDTLFGNDLNNEINGLGGSDTIEGGKGDDQLIGGGGIDNALFQNNLVDYTIVNNASQLEVSGPLNDGNDRLTNIERLHFQDQSLAFDLDGNAGQMVKLLGLMLGADNWHNKEYMGIGLDQLDNTEMTYNEMFDYWYAVVLGPNPTNTEVMNLIYNNLFGFAPTPEDLTTLTEGILDNGLLTQSGLGVLLVDYEGHVANMDLPGLAETGVAYFKVMDSAVGLLVEGDALDNNLAGDTGNDTLIGNDGNDTLQGFAGVDELDGGDGLDHALFQNDLVDFSIVNNAGVLDVLGPINDGYNKLMDIERLHFQDQSLAFDIDGNAGQMAKILGVMLGADDWHHKEFMGIGIDQLDNTEISYEGMMDYWFAEVLGPSPTNTQVMNLVYTNIFGIAPSPEDLTTLTEGILDNGLLTQASLGVLLADYEGNATNIDLIGIADTGVGYLAIG